MKKIFFYIDRTNKQIMFIHYPIDRKGNMIGDTEQYSSISFDDVLTMTEEMNRSFFADLKTVCERLQYYLDFGKQKYPACEKELAEYRSKYENNFFALILINILETEYWAQRDRLLSWDPVIIATAFFNTNIKRAKKALAKKVQELKAAVDRLALYIERDFKCEIEQTMTAKSEIRATVEDDEDRVYMGLNDSFEPFVYFFSRKIQNSNIKLYRCVNCGRKYFHTSDRIYCSREECQHVKLLEYNRNLRETRKQDVYRNLIDSYNAYVRQLKRKLTLMRIKNSDMQIFETEQEQCAAVIREAVSDYREQQKPIDDDLNALIQENRQRMKEVTDRITEKYFG